MHPAGLWGHLENVFWLFTDSEQNTLKLLLVIEQNRNLDLNLSGSFNMITFEQQFHSIFITIFSKLFIFIKQFKVSLYCAPCYSFNLWLFKCLCLERSISLIFFRLLLCDLKHVELQYVCSIYKHLFSLLLHVSNQSRSISGSTKCITLIIIETYFSIWYLLLSLTQTLQSNKYQYTFFI